MGRGGLCLECAENEDRYEEVSDYDIHLLLQERDSIVEELEESLDGHDQERLLRELASIETEIMRLEEIASGCLYTEETDED